MSSANSNLVPSEFAAFAEVLRDHRAQSERLVRRALDRVIVRLPDDTRADLDDVARAVDGTFGALDEATEELRVQNEALFAARVELEGASALFRDLFELAPCAYVVTDPSTRILYANDLACTLLKRRKNALTGKPLVAFVPVETRNTFRDAVERSSAVDKISEWPATLFATGTSTRIHCRMRIRPVSTTNAYAPRALFWTITEETDEDLF